MILIGRDVIFICGRGVCDSPYSLVGGLAYLFLRLRRALTFRSVTSPYYYFFTSRPLVIEKTQGQSVSEKAICCVVVW